MTYLSAGIRGRRFESAVLESRNVDLQGSETRFDSAVPGTERDQLYKSFPGDTASPVCGVTSSSKFNKAVYDAPQALCPAITRKLRVHKGFFKSTERAVLPVGPFFWIFLGRILAMCHLHQIMILNARLNLAIWKEWTVLLITYNASWAANYRLPDDSCEF